MFRIAGIGTDLVHAPRIERILARFGDRFVNRILHPEEQMDFKETNDRIGFLAKRFAAKEALAKALGTGIAQGISFHDFIIQKGALGRPVVRLEYVAKLLADKMQLNHIHLSISDERAYVLAFAVLESAS